MKVRAKVMQHRKKRFKQKVEDDKRAAREGMQEIRREGRLTRYSNYGEGPLSGFARA